MPLRIIIGTAFVTYSVRATYIAPRILISKTLQDLRLRLEIYTIVRRQLLNVRLSI
jgi:hypothetical protein